MFRPKKEDLPIGSFRRPTSTLSKWKNPLTSFISSNHSVPNGSYSNNNNYGMTYDGSASSIRTPSAIQKTWQRTEVPVRITYISILIGIVLMLFGWRWISYNNAGFNLHCHSIACDLSIYPIGFKRTIHLYNIPRQQIINVQSVKTISNGTFVTDQNIVLMETFKKKYSKHQPSSYSKSSSYKGPDENGHYISYAIVLQDKNPNQQQQERIGMINQDSNDGNNNNNEEEITPIPEVELQPILPFLQNIDNDNDNGQQYRLIPRMFYAKHSQRRVRSMISKIETYIKHRRQKLIIIENASPAWQGIVLIVFGAVTILITCTLGQFTNETNYYDPYSSRRNVSSNTTRNNKNNNNITKEKRLQQHNLLPSASIAKRKTTLQSMNQVTTPSQYEVQTQSTTSSSNNKRNNSTSSTNNTAGTTNMNRTTTNNSNNNSNVNYRKTIASAHARSRVVQ
jgi:hypothetical protein